MTTFWRPWRITPEALKAENNNFTLVRLVLASAVILTHCYEQQTGREGADWFSSWLGTTASGFAVDAFFFLSGFLVFRSLHNHGSRTRFLLARLARMYPALLVSVIGTVLIGLSLTSADVRAYFGGETQRFLLGNLSFVKGYYTLTGVRCDGLPCNVNGSLWTLPWEMRCYLALVLLSLLGLIHRRPMTVLVLPATFALAIAWQIPVVQAALQDNVPRAVFWVDITARLWTLFAAGCAAALWRDRIRLHGVGVILLFAVNLAVAIMPFAPTARLLLVGYTVLYCGFRLLRWTPAIARLPDYSYGIYIYAFPAMWLLGRQFPDAGPGAMALLNLAAVLPLAALSWHLVEKPVLDAFRRRSRKGAQSGGRGAPTLNQTEPANG